MGLIQNLLGLINKQEKPLHVGEVMNLWKGMAAFEEGIPLPPAGTDKPKANEKDIPVGGKFTDSEIADFLAAKVVASTGVTQQALLETLRYDLANMLVELEVDSYRQAFVLREIMERRGWLKTPPYWYPSKASD